jgi:hypothetical protein
MSMRRHTPRKLRPALESLEGRRLLTKTISGVDADGDSWTLTLVGPGDFRVTNQPNAAGDPVPIGQPAQIDQILVAGPDPLRTRLVGAVVKGANGDGKVFFQSLVQQGGRSEGPVATNGLLAIDMPAFWLGHTSTTAPSTTDPTADAIDIPDGIQTLRFGGVDTTFTPTGGTPLNQNATSDAFTVNLGLPRTQGTSIIVSKVVSSGAPAAAGSPTATPTQDSVTFNVGGRLNVFQADEIDGNSAVPSSGFRGGGGTLVVSAPDTISAITGQIGFVRVGGNATNFSVQSGGTTGYISNFFIGGETNNVQALSVGGMRNVGFGKGMDTVTILSHSLMTLSANRGALNSNVSIERSIGNITFGGPVVGTTILSGVNANLGGASGVFATQTAPTVTPAQDGGTMHNVLIAGDVTDSIFAASTETDAAGTYGTSDSLFLPHGLINAKVQGTIDNTNTTPNQPDQAFYAKLVHLTHGPVVPPHVPEAPFADFGAPPTGSRVVHGLQPSDPTTVTPKKKPTATTSSDKAVTTKAKTRTPKTRHTQ